MNLFKTSFWAALSSVIKMLAQDTGGAIRGVVRADFFWGSGAEPGALAGKMRQSGQMWVLFPRAHVPENSEGGTN